MLVVVVVAVAGAAGIEELAASVYEIKRWERKKMKMDSQWSLNHVLVRARD
jgi:hypothetical protein